MPSFNNPKVTNPIKPDVSEIRELLKIVAKQDYTGATDLPEGAKRLATVSGGVQLQKYANSSWSSIGKLLHDVDTLDGYHASTTAVANRVPVYNASAQLVGSITGNAATATKLASKRTIDIGGIASADAVGFDGSGNITIPLNSINVANDDDNALVGIVSKAHGGTGRNDGAAADVLVNSLAGPVKASEYGQIGYTKFITSDLNTLTVPGHYISNTATIELHYPVAQSQTVHTIHVYQQGTYIRQILRDHFSEWIRTSSNSGSSWTAWRCLSAIKTGSFYVYVSKSGSDDNTGMNSANPVLTINRAFEIINSVVAGNSSIIAYMRIGSGYWGNIQISNSKYPVYIEDYSSDTGGEYSENFPSFGTITAKNSFLFVRNAVCNAIQSDASSYISIERYLRVSSIRSNNNSYITMTTGNYEISSSGVSYVFLVDYHSALSINTGAKITIIESISPSSAFLGVSHDSYFGLNDASPITVPEGVTVTCRKYSLYKTACVWFYNASMLDNLPGTLPGIKQVGVIIDGIPYGGGASDEALMADLSWKPVLLQTGGIVKGTIESTANPLIKTSNWENVSITDTSRTSNSTKMLAEAVDKDGKRFFGLEVAATTDGSRICQIIGRNRADNAWLVGLRITENSDGSYYMTCGTPPDTASGGEVITAKWFNKKTDSKLEDYLSLGGGTMTGTIKVPEMAISRGVNNGILRIWGGTGNNDGATLLLFGGENTTYNGQFILRAVKDSVWHDLVGKVDTAELTWCNKNIVRSVNGVNADVNGNVAMRIGMSNRNFYSENGTFTVPEDGVYKFILVSGGQGGSNSSGDGKGGRGGDGGRYQEITLLLTKGTKCSITIGTGGARGGNLGTDSSVTINSLNYSSVAGVPMSNGGLGAPNSSSGSKGIKGDNGGFGGTGGNVSGFGGGGGGGYVLYGIEAPTAASGTSGAGGNSNGGYGYGAGGAGGGNPVGSYNGLGGAGAPGCVVVYY